MFHCELSGLKVLLAVLCPSGKLPRVDSANRHYRFKFLNFSARKTCQNSRVASLLGRAGWIQVSLLKGALRFITKSHPTLAVVSAICHCSALWLEREGAC